MRDYMRAIREANIREVCVESRPHPDFAGPDWWRDMDIILEEAEKRGMRVWILDDQHFPTGYAAGAVLKADMELTHQYLDHNLLGVAGPAKEMTIDVKAWAKPQPAPPWMPPEPAGLKKWHDDYLFRLLASKVGEEGKDGETVDLTAQVKDGMLTWDVPEGYWQVKYEKEGYETVYSDWLPVPPPQTEVNVGLVSKEKPVLEWAVVYADHARLMFSKYMQPDTVASLVLKDENGNPVPYTLEYDTDSVSPEGVNYAKEYTLRFGGDTVLALGSSCVLESDGTEKSYAGTAMDRVQIRTEVRRNVEIVAPDSVTVAMGETAEIPVFIAGEELNDRLEAAAEAERSRLLRV